MSTSLSRPFDIWRMVAARRILEGRLPLSALPRLSGLLFDSEGDVTFQLEFDRDALGIAYVGLEVETRLPLQCQRSLGRFELPVRLHHRLGLLRKEADEAGLPPGYEPLLVPENGELCASDIIADELILAVPVVPIDPEGAAEPAHAPPSPPADDAPPENPFAILAALKQKT